MRGVDRGDQMVALYGSGRKSVKAWKRIFFYLLECSMLNCYIIEGHFNERHHLKGRRKRDMKEFKTELAEQLISGFCARGKKVQDDHPELRLNPALGHLPVFDEEKRSRNCVLCSSKRLPRSQTSIRCSVCKVHLCICGKRNCFYEYHTTKEI